MKNQVQLITYVDRLSGGGFAALEKLLFDKFTGLFGGVHALPFYHTIDGADAGFDPIDHAEVDARLGTWTDVKSLATKIDVMADVIVNHMSDQSPEFLDYSANGEQSRYAGLFMTLESVFPNGASDADLLALYRPRPGLPFSVQTLQTGERKVLWTTFTSRQIDIDVEHTEGKAYLSRILRTLAQSGVKMIRLDAVGYAIKRAGRSSFMMPETFSFIDTLSAEAKSLGLEVLVEIHSHYKTQIDVAHRVDYVYDFALPPLVLHSLFFRTHRCLVDWLTIRPTNALTVLDTHDGIGVIDVGADATDRHGKPGLVPPAELDALVERIHRNCGEQSRSATGAAASNLDLYQVNCTFYDALGRDDNAYLMARAMQYFVPGVPQVYYVGLLAGANDMSLLAKTGVGRDINRHYYSPKEIDAELQRPIVKDLVALTRLRNTHPAFNGEFSYQVVSDTELTLRWTAEAAVAELTLDFARPYFRVRHTLDGLWQNFQPLSTQREANAPATA